MAKSSAPDRAGWLLPAAAIVLALTVWRVVLLAFNQMDLFVDEAQYWLWGQELAFGYYSKPPMIGWLIRAVTTLAGSDAPFWVRLPGPMLHGTTAMILGSIAAALFGARVAVLTAAAFVSLPMVAVGSILISTDTVMFPFLALALAGYLALLRGAGPWMAILTGIALGLAFLSKYAAIYYLICAVLVALFQPEMRPEPRAVTLVLAAFALTISPNVVWNMFNGFSTLEHTLDNADWVRDPGTRAGLNLANLGRFLASQFAVFGPVLFAGLLVLGLRARRTAPPTGTLLWFTLPIIAIVCVQAVLSNAYANWAAAAYLAGTLAVVPWLGRGWLALSFAINGAIALALPLAGAYAAGFQVGGKPVLARYLGRADMSRAIIDTAHAQGLNTVVTGNRDILADLFYTGRNANLDYFALPPQGRAPHHYALKYPYSGNAADQVLYVSPSSAAPACAPDLPPLKQIDPATGAYRGKPQYLFLMPGDCWQQE